MKQIKLFCLLLVVVIGSFMSVKAENENWFYFGMVSQVNISNHSLVVPGDAYIGYSSVQESFRCETKFGMTFCYTTVNCNGNGPKICPSLFNITIEMNSILPPHSEQNLLDDQFVKESNKLMEEHVIKQLEGKNLSGVESFNVIYKDIPIYRKVTWVSDLYNLKYETSITPMPK